MPWTADDYPDSLKNFTAPVRKKAIEIANALLEDEQYGEGRAIAIATAQAQQWANERDIPVKKKGADGDSEAGSVDKGASVHVVHHEDGWAVRSGSSDVAKVHDTKNDAVVYGRKLARRHNTDLVIHGADGKIQSQESQREKSSDERYHVCPRGDEWVVNKEGSDRAIRVFDRKSDAVAAGTQMARNQYGTLVIHDESGDTQRCRDFARTPARG